MSSVLLIDDDAQLRRLLRKILEWGGYKVHEASDGDEGVRQYRQQPTDLVLCDIFMPGMDGIGTLRELRNEFPDVRVIVISGGSAVVAKDFLPDARMLGATRTLAKPFDADTLLQTVREVLQG